MRKFEARRAPCAIALLAAVTVSVLFAGVSDSRRSIARFWSRAKRRGGRTSAGT